MAHEDGEPKNGGSDILRRVRANLSLRSVIQNLNPQKVAHILESIKTDRFPPTDLRDIFKQHVGHFSEVEQYLNVDWLPVIFEGLVFGREMAIGFAGNFQMRLPADKINLASKFRFNPNLLQAVKEVSDRDLQRDFLYQYYLGLHSNRIGNNRQIVLSGPTSNMDSTVLNNGFEYDDGRDTFRYPISWDKHLERVNEGVAPYKGGILISNLQDPNLSIILPDEKNSIPRGTDSIFVGTSLAFPTISEDMTDTQLFELARKIAEDAKYTHTINSMMGFLAQVYDPQTESTSLEYNFVAYSTSAAALMLEAFGYNSADIGISKVEPIAVLIYCILSSYRGRVAKIVALEENLTARPYLRGNDWGKKEYQPLDFVIPV